MKKFVLSAALFFSALAGNAEGISSPSGMVKLDFELASAPSLRIPSAVHTRRAGTWPPPR